MSLRIDKNTAWKVALIWTYSVVWASLPFVGWSRYEYEPYKLSCTLDWYKPSMLAISFIAAAGTFTFFLPLVISAVYYTKIITIVFMNDQNTSRVYQNSVTTNYRRMEFGRSKRVALMTLVLLLSFILAWGPYVVLAIMGSFGFFHLPSYRSALVAPILAKSSVFINPVITYVLVEKQFRWAVIELLCRVTIHPTAVSPRLNPMPK
ncbi:visual pigment-like receptor peropsin [Lineus longissimus]|uniref:visual pigment-like receptor peropsin n=1 Tax=Lineus longissimus TaxID=88925 RepID=UPI00315C6E5C